MYFIYTSYIKVYFKYTSSNFSAGEKIFPKKSVLYYKYILKKLKTPPENIICWNRFKTKVY